MYESPITQDGFGGITMADITYCVSLCPFTDCVRHYSKIKELQKQGQKYVSVADLAPTCRRYIAYVVEEVDNG